ncbi:hypothetical protein FOXB_03072 [Fusarium oxysporum f. sp. conglutinans Fo5176]|uniref:Zinc-ribbon domain-containing protein n=1 Tax=Fusarium oxysporum (strain Fo5176) TaxID=660025 RepID=F9F9J7_FUSOF|nr:hypothetical protein FOXB_03072 [Fusarium oxysporum f. sp. conglutinans Fo5176]
MVNCSKCGYNNMSGSQTCAQCGASLPVVVSKSLEDPGMMEGVYTGFFNEGSRNQ